MSLFLCTFLDISRKIRKYTKNIKSLFICLYCDQRSLFDKPEDIFIDSYSDVMGNCFCTRTDRPVVRGVSHITPSSTKSISPADNGSQLENEHEKRAITKEDVIRNGNKERVGSYKESNNDDERSGKIITPNLKMFTLSELKKATRNFRPDTVLGEGGFGRVFKGWINENTFSPSKVGAGMPVAVKKSNPDSSQGHKEWQAEVKFLGKFSHPNLVKLIGYCWEENQYLLVYEHMQKGSLENHLFRKGAESLSWKTRLEIAVGAARGLAFLHNSEKSVIYRDFKAANILLDNAYNAKLSDFGLAKFGPVNGQSHVTTQVIGTYGYAAPEYIATGHLYVKSDVYGFGVVLLELLTGLRALDSNRPNGKHNLVDWAQPSLSEKKKLKKIMDPAIGDQYPIKGAMKSSELIMKCIDSDPKSRPSMDEVLQTLEIIKDIKEKTKETKKCNDKRQEKHSLYNARSPIHRMINGTNPTSYYTY